MRRQLTALAAAGAIAATGVAGGIVAGAAILPATAAQPDTEDGGSQFAAERVDRIREALEELVGDGTISQEQADAVAEELADSGPFGPHHGRGHHPGGGLAGTVGAGLDAAAETLGIPEDELRQALRDGQTLAEVAEDRGVATSELVEALLAVARERLDEAVEDGRLSAERAERLAAGLEEHVTRLVEEGMPVQRGGR